MGGQIEVKNAATIMGQDQKHVKDVETDVGDSEEIDRPYLPTGGKIFLLNSMTDDKRIGASDGTRTRSLLRDGAEF